jgi:tRNA 2-thiouridine synthesizing protein A
MKAPILQKPITPEKIALSIGVRGLLCPVPVQRTREAIGKIDRGQVLEVITSDPTTLVDIPAWATTENQKLLKTVDDWLTIKFYIQRVT